jgi:thiamine biosynthesis lipoprotein
VSLFRFLPLCFATLFTSFFQKGEQRLHTIDGFAQGTDYSLRYYADRELVSKAQIDSILEKIDVSMSLYKPQSLINQFNGSEKGLRVDAGFRAVIRKSMEIFAATDGRFDITVAPLVQLWGFGPVPIDRFPDSAQVLETLKQVGMKKLQLKGNMLRKSDPLVRIDLNGIAQGFSVDVLAAFLRSEGIQSYMVEIGGEVVVKGNKPDGSGYRIGIEGPPPEPVASEMSKVQPFRHVVELSSGAITTSGNFNKFLKYKKGKISHLIDPKTGYPLDNPMISVTVYAKDAITADGYDNALMAMDLDEAMTFVAKRKDLEAYFIYRKPDGSLRDTLTSGFKKLLVN